MRQYSPSNCEFPTVRLLGPQRRPEEYIFENSDPTLGRPTSLLRCGTSNILPSTALNKVPLRSALYKQLLEYAQALSGTGCSRRFQLLSIMMDEEGVEEL